mmetsp:Transcript_42633/g.120945  ORF Transcript_42633/g.120945 Transcript_42633/m.120945 type:complete len:81 (-) Transcript_42633:169-411(-)
MRSIKTVASIEEPKLSFCHSLANAIGSCAFMCTKADKPYTASSCRQSHKHSLLSFDKEGRQRPHTHTHTHKHGTSPRQVV